MMVQTVIIVDDDNAFRESLEALLWVMEIKTRSYQSGTAFLEARDFSGDICVLLDYRLPDIDGLEVLRALTALPSRPPVLMVSGDASARVKESALALGALATLDKPVNGAKLLDVIESARQATGEARRACA